jgi:hypothetical protein
MNRMLVLCLAALTLAGCKSRPLSVTVSPRLTGRVLAADTGQPIADVKVRNIDNTEDFNRTSPPKGAERMLAKRIAYTDHDGRFVLETERVLAPFGGAGWLAVRLSFERAGYERFLTNYSYLNLSTNSAGGGPGLSAGNILLHPAVK